MVSLASVVVVSAIVVLVLAGTVVVGASVVLVVVDVVASRSNGTSSVATGLKSLEYGTPHAAATTPASPAIASTVIRTADARSLDVLEARDEPRTATGAVLDPRVAAVRLRVLGDEGEAEAGPDVVAAGAAAGEPLEDPRPLAAGDTRSGVLHADLDAAPAVSVDDHPRRPAAVLAGVLEEVGEDPLEADLVEAHRRRHRLPMWIGTSTKPYRWVIREIS